MKKVTIWLILILVIIFFNLSMLVNVLTSFKSDVDISHSPPVWLFKPVLTHYVNIFMGAAFHFSNYVLNSTIIALVSTILAIFITLPAAYSIVRYGGFGYAVLGTSIMLRLLPALGMAIPIFMLFNYVDLIDTRTAIILMHTLFITPTSLLLFIGYVQELPREMEEAAMIDGATVIQVIWYVLIPVIRPGLAAVAILGFITSWNEFLFSVVLSFKKAVTVTVGTSFFVQSYEVAWGNMSAAITISIVPTVLFIFLAQKHLIKGMTAGSVKG